MSHDPADAMVPDILKELRQEEQLDSGKSSGADGTDARLLDSVLDIKSDLKTDSLSQLDTGNDSLSQLDTGNDSSADCVEVAELQAELVDVCSAACDDKECGDDGCGGSCGTCTGGQVCWDEICICPSPPSMLQEHTFGGEKQDEAAALAALAGGDLILAGYTQSKGAGDGDAWLIKTDAGGTILWDRTLGDTQYDTARALAVLPDDSLAVAGGTRSKGAGLIDAWLVVTNSAGIAQWDKTYGGEFDDWALAVAPLQDGGFLLTGTTKPGLEADNDLWVARTDAAGTPKWEVVIGGEGTQEGLVGVQLDDGHYLVAGATDSKGGGKLDAWLLKFDDEGGLVWEKTHGGPEDETARSLVVLQDSFIIGGGTSSKGSGSWDYWLVSTDTEGNLLWDQVHGGMQGDFSTALGLLPDGGFLVLGQTYSFGSGEGDAWLVRTDSSGELIWGRVFGGSGDEFPRAMQLLPEARVVFAGLTTSKGAGHLDIWLVEAGVLVCGCEPDCSGKQCGDDGCGGTCGACP